MSSPAPMRTPACKLNLVPPGSSARLPWRGAIVTGSRALLSWRDTVIKGSGAFVHWGNLVPAGSGARLPWRDAIVNGSGAGLHWTDAVIKGSGAFRCWGNPGPCRRPHVALGEERVARGERRVPALDENISRERRARSPSHARNYCSGDRGGEAA